MRIHPGRKFGHGRLPVLVVLTTVLLSTGVVTAPAAQAAKRGANGQIAYTIFNGTADQVVRKNADGSGVVTPLTPPATNFLESSWSPDGTMIAAVQYSVGIVMFPSRGGPIVTLDADPQDFMPSWSPDGHYIAFVKAGDIVIVPVDLSTGPITIVAGGVSPDWSSDGEQIAYVDAAGTLFTVDAVPSAGTPVPRTVPGAVLHDPIVKQISWSPDRTRIVYAKAPHGGLQYVHLGNLAPTDINGPPGASEPAWSPDGRRIAFGQRANAANQAGVFTTPVGDGSYTTVDASGYVPDWEACRYRCHH